MSAASLVITARVCWIKSAGACRPSLLRAATGFGSGALDAYGSGFDTLGISFQRLEASLLSSSRTAQCLRILLKTFHTAGKDLLVR